MAEEVYVVLPEDLEEEFQFYVRFAKPLAIKIRNYSDRINASKWVTRLENEPDRKLKNDYLKLLLFAMQRPSLIVPFNAPPSEEPLKQLEGSKLTDMAGILWKETINSEQASGDSGPPCFVETSADDRQYVAYQEIPNFGIHCFLALSNSEPIRKWITPNHPSPPDSKSKQATSQSSTLISSNNPPKGVTNLPRWIEKMTRTLKDEIELVVEPARPGSKSPPRTPTRQRDTGSPRNQSFNLIEFSPIQNARQPSIAPPCNDDFAGADDFDFGDMDFQSADQFIEREGSEQLPFDQPVTRAADLMGEVDWQNLEQFRCHYSPPHDQQTTPKAKSPLRDQELPLNNWNDFIPGSRGTCTYSKSPTRQRQNIQSPPLIDEWSNFAPGMPINNDGAQNICPSNIQNVPGAWEESNYGGANFDMAIPGPSRHRNLSPPKSPRARSKSPCSKSPQRPRSKSPPRHSPDPWDTFQPGVSEFQKCPASPRQIPATSPHQLNFDDWNNFTPSGPVSPRKEISPICPGPPRQIPATSPHQINYDDWNNFTPSGPVSPRKEISPICPKSPRQIPATSPHQINYDDWDNFTPSGPVSPRKEISPICPGPPRQIPATSPHQINYDDWNNFTPSGPVSPRKEISPICPGPPRQIPATSPHQINYDDWDNFTPSGPVSPRKEISPICPKSPRQIPATSPHKINYDDWDNFTPSGPVSPRKEISPICPKSPRQIPATSPHQLNYDDWNNFAPSGPVSPRKEISPRSSPCDFSFGGDEDLQFQDAAAIIEQERDEDEQWPFDDVEVQRAQDLLQEFNIADHSEQFSPPSPCRNIREVASRTRMTGSLDPQGHMRDAHGNIVSEVTSKMRDPDGTEITLRRSLRREIDENGIGTTPVKGGKKVPRRLTYGESNAHEQRGVEVEQLYVNPSLRSPRRQTPPCQPPSTPQGPSRRGPGQYSLPAKFQSPCRKRATFDHRHSPLADTSPIQPVERLNEEEQGFQWLENYPRKIFWNIKDQPPKMTTCQMRQSIREGNYPHGSRIPYSPPAPSSPPAYCYSPRTPPSGRLSPGTPPGWPQRSPLPQSSRPMDPRSMELPEGEPFSWLDAHPYQQQGENFVHADDLPESPVRQETIRRYYPCPGNQRNQNT